MENPIYRYYEFGEFRLDVKERLLLKNGGEIPLTGRIYDLLLALVKSEGRTLEHEELLETVWPDAIVEQANLKKGISTLRKILGEGPDESRYIRTLPRRGYRFVAPVKAIVSDDEQSGFAARRARFAEITIEEEIIEDDEENIIALQPAQRIQEGSLASRQNTVLLGHHSHAAQLIEVATTKSETESSKRKRKIILLAAALVGMIVVALTALSVYRFWQRDKNDLPNIENLVLSKLSNSKNVLVAHVTPDGQSIVYVTMEENGDRALWMRRISNKTSIQLMPPAPVFFWGWAISHDGGYVYYVIANRNDTHGSLYRVSLLGGAPRKLVDELNGCGHLSPDDKRILVVRTDFKSAQTKLLSVNATDGSDEKIIASDTDALDFVSPHWSPDRTKVVYARSEKNNDEVLWTIVEKTIDGGAERKIIAPRKGRIWQIGWIKDEGFVMNATDPVTNLAQLYYVSYPDGAERRITNDLGSYFGLSVSADGKTIVAAQRFSEQRIWIASQENANEGRQLTPDPNITGTFAWTPDGRIVYAATDNNKSHIWIVNGDGSNQQQLTPDDSIDHSPSVSPDGRYIVFVSRRTGDNRLWRMDIDGRNQKPLYNGKEDVRRPQIAAGSQTVLFSLYRDAKWTLGQIAIEGGEVKQLTNNITELFSLSSDGKLLACTSFDEQTRKTQMIVRPLTGDGPARTFDVQPNKFLLWTTDNKGLLYDDSDTKRSTQSTVWLQPISGGEPKPFLTRKPDWINYIAISPDGKRIAYTDGKLLTDAIMLTERK
jgi:Tol biopolymer transport system component/DNA-binding winged helix-turn-helix (wHTH) protein